jgi:hypothetical protein
MPKKAKKNSEPRAEAQNRWYERWTTYIAGLTALGLAIVGFLTMGTQLTDKLHDIFLGVGIGASPYEKAVRDATRMLDSYPLPLVGTPKCTQLAGQGQQLRGLVASIGDIRAVERRADQTSDTKERELALGVLENVYKVRSDVAKWHEEVVKEGCIKSS